MGKKKFYINEEGVIEVTPFFDKQVKKNQEYIELTFEEWQEKLSTSTYGFKKVYKDGEIIEVEDENISNYFFSNIRNNIFLIHDGLDKYNSKNDSNNNA